MSRPARGAWIEILRGSDGAGTARSRPARGAWIEMTSGSAAPGIGPVVAPRTGRVD